MSKRLQVVLDEVELAEIQGAAQRQRLSVSEWVRQTLREARRREPLHNTRRRLDAIREATSLTFPTADIDQMLEEIARGRQT